MVKIVHWNPYRRVKRTGPLRRIPLPRRVNNFGDLIGPLIVERLRHRDGLRRSVTRRSRLLTVGSIAHFGREGDTMWGTGVNGKITTSKFPLMDVRAVRGPRTRAVLESAGLSVPPVYGDPALLLPHLFRDSEFGIKRGTGGTVIVPNLHDVLDAPQQSIDPRGNLIETIRIIASAELVVASSLHGLIIAEAYGVPVVPVLPGAETTFKYADYFEGTGRALAPMNSAWNEDGVRAAPLQWDPTALVAAFPRDLWHS